MGGGVYFEWGDEEEEGWVLLMIDGCYSLMGLARSVRIDGSGWVLW